MSRRSFRSVTRLVSLLMLCAPLVLRVHGADIQRLGAMAAAGDLRFVDIPVELPRQARMMNAYMARLVDAAQRDAVISEAYQRVANLIDPPSALRRPSIAIRVAFASRHHASPSAARVVVPCTSVDVSTRIFGALLSPSRLTSQPARESTAPLSKTCESRMTP